jgi:hypothetical protein
MVSIFFDLLSFEKSSTTPDESREKKYLQNWACKVSKDVEFCADFKNMC